MDWKRRMKAAQCGKVETERQNILNIVRRLQETRLETSMKKEADKIRKYGKKNRRIGNG